MLRFDFENSVGYWICMTSQAMRRAFSSKLAEEGITLRQWEVLASLAMNGDASQSDLAEYLGIEPHTLAGILRRMERDGWLRRRCCDDDRRRNRLEPTEKAEEIWQRALHRCHEVRAQATAGFTAAELSLLKKLCDEIRQNLATVESPAPPAERRTSRPRSGKARSTAAATVTSAR